MKKTMMQIIYLTKKRNQQILLLMDISDEWFTSLDVSWHLWTVTYLETIKDKALEQTCFTITYNDFVMIMSQKEPHHNNRFLIYDNFQQPLTESLEHFLKLLLYWFNLRCKLTKGLLYNGHSFKTGSGQVVHGFAGNTDFNSACIIKS